MISSLLPLVVLGFALFLIERFIPMDPVIVIVIRVIVVILVVLYLARLFGVADIPLPRVK